MEQTINSENKSQESKLAKFFSNKTNIWIAVSAVLLIAIIAVIFGNGSSNASINKNQAGEKLVSFLNSNVVQGGGVTLSSVTDEGSIYQVNVLYQGQDIPVFISKDGKYFAQSAVLITNDPVMRKDVSASAAPSASTTVSKTDKPKVEAFIFSYCPYGLQFEKALIPVYNLLKDKADINIVAIGAMHGEYEKIESLRQSCIQKNYGKDKLFAYLDKFALNTAIGSCNGNDACLTPLLTPLLSSLSIDKSKIDSCMASEAEALYNTDGARASSLGIGGSPTFVINGAQVQVGRNPEAIKTAICNAFTDSSRPNECSQTLSTTPATPSFG